VVEAVPSGRVLDVGCGHGLVVGWLGVTRPDVQVVGVDPDVRKVSLARRALEGMPRVELRVGTAEVLERDFDAITLLDVLYLLPRDQWPGFLQCLHERLRPGGRLLLKEAEGDSSWRHYKCLAQEWVMGRALGRTPGNGALPLVPRADMKRLLREAGFEVTNVVDLRRGYTTPHVLYEARRP
jgi:2-polyprenyl-6-hydroxyphenyl methylase/3-demethylubiquinone-9 3-methyltransferase